VTEWLNQTVSPGLNATLNGLSGVLLVVGYIAIKRRVVTLHKVAMLSALVVSAVFLASYLYYHFAIKRGVATEFAAQNPSASTEVGYFYYALLGSHMILAVIAAPLALVTAYLGLRDRLTKHVRIARWTLPIWLYVSVTGVVVYWMLYRLYSPAG
jgi:putative membrane protein